MSRGSCDRRGPSVEPAAYAPAAATWTQRHPLDTRRTTRSTTRRDEVEGLVRRGRPTELATAGVPTFLRADYVRRARAGDSGAAPAGTGRRSQGSQYDSVSIILAGLESPLLTLQMLYTAITRARHRVRIVGDPEAVSAAVQRQARRESGLQRALTM